MESGGIESSSSPPSSARGGDVVGPVSSLRSGVGENISRKVLLLDGDSLDTVQLHKMKLMTENVVVSDKVLATAPPLPPSTSSSLCNTNRGACNNDNNNNNKNELQIVELSDLLLTTSSGPEKSCSREFNQIGGSATEKIKVGHHGVVDEDQLIDFSTQSSEKCDKTPENLKKNDQESLLIDLDDGSAMVMQFCDMTNATAAAVASDSPKESVQLTLLDLDEPPPPTPPSEKPKAFTISFGEEERSEEQKQKYEKMFERFQNKRHKRGQSLSKVDVDLAKSASQESNTALPCSPAPSNTSTTKSGAATTTNINTNQSNNHKLSKTPSSAKLPRKTFSEPSSTKATEDQQQQHLDDDAKVKLRDKRNAAMREPSKRHSWSPRTTTTMTSTNNCNSNNSNVPPALESNAPTKKNEDQTRSKREKVPVVVSVEPEKDISTVQNGSRPLQVSQTGRFTARSSVLNKVLVDTRTVTRNVIDCASAVGQTQVQQQPQVRQLPEAPPPVATVKKNAMQRGFVCEAHPLIDDSKEVVDEELSDAGTYTLDGDNYTEEQKEMMDIDNLKKEAQLLNKWDELEGEEDIQGPVTFLKCKRPPLQRPTSFEPSLEIIDLELIPSSPKELKALESDLNNYYDDENVLPLSRRSNGRNVLDISCKYEEPKTKSVPSSAAKQKISYLEKIKTKVKSFSGKPSSNRPDSERQLPSPDIGTFTSVTTSGILSYKPTLEDKPVKMGRRNSLTKTQIQNTEYVQGVSRVLPADAECDEEKILNSITDSDKLNLLSSSENDETTTTSSSSALKSAVTKNDWIHEWAKNARRSTTEMSRSFTVDSNVNRLQDDPMSRSECFAKNQAAPTADEDAEYGDNLDRHQAQKKQHLTKTGHFVRGRSDDPNSPLAQLRYSVRRRYSGDKGGLLMNCSNDALTATDPSATYRRPPMSPTKIPSPVHTISRARSMSHNRSQGGSTTDLSLHSGGGHLMSPNGNNDTDVYLQNTAAAILTLQSMHLNNNNSLHNSPSPSHPSSPSRGRAGRTVSSPLHSLSPQRVEGGYNIIEECQNKMNRIQQLHKRNLSLDGSERDRNRTRYGKSSALSRVQRTDPQQHTRHHSYEGTQVINSRQQSGGRMGVGIDQTMANGAEEGHNIARQHQHAMRGVGAPQSSPIRRSSSFSTKPGGGITQGSGGGGHQRVKSGGGGPVNNVRQMNSIKKSASSTSFKKYHYEDEGDIYINDDDDLDPAMSNDSEYSYDMDEVGDQQQQQQQQGKHANPITNTRCNKAFLIRREQSKNKPTTVAVVGSAQVGKQQGVVACPNTPEMSRRGALGMLRQPLRDRQSMPRDSSLSRMKQDLSMNLTSTKKALKEPPVSVGSSGGGGNGTKVQPKYLDISKYKPTTTGNFLKKDESKSYLVKSSGGSGGGGVSGAVDGIKRSPSSASVTLTRTDPTRMSNRSVKSAGMRPNLKKEPIDVAKVAKEQELALWRRRASYDPMKAAMEGKRRQEEAKRMLAQQQQQSKLPESAMVLRSQSFHSGATMMRHMDTMEGLIDDESNPDSNTRWTTESSDEDF